MAEVSTPEEAWRAYVGETTVEELLDAARQALPPQEWAYEDAVRWYLSTQAGMRQESPDSDQPPFETIVSLIGEHIRDQMAGEVVTLHKGERQGELRDRRNYVVSRSPYSADVPESWPKAYQKLVQEADQRGLILADQAQPPAE